MKRITTSIALVTLSGLAHAQVGESHAAHVHGNAELLLVLEGEQLEIELHSPAMNLLGFEHQASSPEEKARLEDTRATLEDASKLFQFSPAHCQPTEQAIELGHLAEADSHHDEDHQHDSENHSDPDGGHHDDEEHGDIEAHYRFHCESADGLASMTTSIPTLFPGIESLQVQWIVGGLQGSTTLDKDENRVPLK